MNEIVSTPALASVVVLKIQEFTRRPVAEQIGLKAQLEALVTLAIRSLPAAERIVLDAPDGVAVVVLGSPRDALELAERSQAAADLPLGIGVNHGPVKPATDALRGPGLVGDGLAAGMTLANVATPGRFLASRSFHEALEAFAPGRADELSSAGVFTDSNVRTHELFTLDPQAANARRRRLIDIGILTVAAILGLGTAARFARLDSGPVPVRPAVIAFEITPRGEVVINGVPQGRSPPLTRLEVDPGYYTIEVRNSPYPPLKLNVNLGSAEEMTITHSFAKPKSTTKSKTQSARESARELVRDVRRQLGF
ncbi:MAG: hypothetical protein HYU76_10535 [Betaproteobacteria bacterium]|nr:hypothetical protein [Betaproteobacteria bacterium]